LMAGLDGVHNKIHPGDPIDKNLYDLEPEEAAKVPHPCASLDEALDNLDHDREFLTRGGVFTDDMIDAYIALKMEEVTRFRMAPPRRSPRRRVNRDATASPSPSVAACTNASRLRAATHSSTCRGLAAEAVRVRLSAAFAARTAPSLLPGFRESTPRRRRGATS